MILMRPRSLALWLVFAAAPATADLSEQFLHAPGGTGLVILQPGAPPSHTVPLTAFAPAKLASGTTGMLAPAPAPADLTPAALQRAAGLAFALGLKRVCVPTVGLTGKEAPISAQPYWRMCDDLERSIARIAVVLGQGRLVTDVAVIGTRDTDALEEVAEQLLRSQLDFRVVDQAQLAAARIDGNAIIMGGGRYTRLVLPPMDAIEPAALDKLEAFARAGGVVMAIRRLPGG
ncbi:MAG: hypothetical protein ACE5O2_09500, partial [Armatimonadota bacterium]